MNSADNMAAISGGDSNHAISYSFVGGGSYNNANQNFCVVGGGYQNAINAPSSVIGGGELNSIDAPHSFIGGGRSNKVGAFGEYSLVLGGEMNSSTGYHSATLSGQSNTSDNGALVAGGHNNNALGTIATISGGADNNTMGTLSVIAGGSSNVADGAVSAVGGGNDNRTLGEFSMIPGGSHNIAEGDYSFAAGHQAHAAHAGAFVWVDNSQLLQTQWASTAPNQFIVRAAGGVGINTNAPHSNLQVKGSIAETLTVTSANLTLSKAHDIVAVNSTSAALTITLPTAGGISGRRYTVKKTDASVNAVKLQASGTQKIDGVAFLLLSTQWKYVTVISDGSNWLVIGQN